MGVTQSRRLQDKAPIMCHYESYQAYENNKEHLDVLDKGLRDDLLHGFK